MTMLSYLAAGLPAAPTRLDPLQLFLDADIVVQIVILGLLLASVWVWTIIVSFSWRVGSLRRKSIAFEHDFFASSEPERLIGGRKKSSVPAARVAAAGMAELKESTKSRPIDRDGTRQRVAQIMDGQVAHETDLLAERLNFLATTGSVAPFVGLFGTVWGIMNSFFQIGSQANSSLAVVAPGISEALFATAIGLFAAIPAVIAYNRFSHKVNRYEARLHRFSDRLQAQISRELESA